MSACMESAARCMCRRAGYILSGSKGKVVKYDAINSQLSKSDVLMKYSAVTNMCAAACRFSDNQRTSDDKILFGSAKITEAYAKYRPTYGTDVYETIVDFCRETLHSLTLAVDVGCGSGQSTVPLTAYFANVIGVDVSEKQIAQAPTDIPNLSFRVGPAEDLSFLEEGSVSLVTVAQAMHWMNVDKLYSEAQRVLKPGGSFVSYGYGLVTSDEPDVQKVFDRFYGDILGPFWSGGREKVREHYHSFSLPFPGWRRNDSLQIERTWNVDHVIGYLTSSSGWHEHLARNPESKAMKGMRAVLQQTHNTGNHADTEDRLMKVRWPVFMLMGHKPLS